MKEFGRLDLLFNAGVGTPPVPLEDLTSTSGRPRWRPTHRAVPVHPACLPHHEGTRTSQGGRIINNGSISAYALRPFSSPYTATKHAIFVIPTCATALGIRAYNIACGQIDVGNAATEMTERMAGGAAAARRQDGGAAHGERRRRYRSWRRAGPLDANALFLNIMATCRCRSWARIAADARAYRSRPPRAAILQRASRRDGPGHA